MTPSEPELQIAITDDWQRVACGCANWAALQQRARLRFFDKPFDSEHAAAAALAPFQIIVPMRERLPFPRSLLEQLPQLRLLALAGRGTRHIDMQVCAERRIVCCGSGSPSPAATAELTLGLILAAMRHIASADAAMRDGAFQTHVPLGRALEGQTLGIVGLGRIGARVATYGHALGMRVLAWSPNLKTEQARAGGAEAVGKTELLQSSDVVSLHLVLSQRSRGVLGAAELALMRPGTLLVNTARGPLVDEAALLAALQSGRIRAALDVYDQEPLAADHPLRHAPNTVLTPHLGFNTAATFDEFYGQSVENILAFLDGRPIRVLSG